MNERTKRWSRRGLLAVAAVTAVILSGCAAGGGTAGGDDGAEIRIGAIYLDSQGYYGGVKAGVEAAAEESGLNVKFIETNPGGDVAKESEFMTTLVSSGVSAIIISAASADSSVPAIKQAFDAGIPVICYNTCVNDDAVEKYVTAYIIGDPVTFGSNLGEAAVAAFTEAGITAPKIGVINCEQYEVCKLRLQGFEDALVAGLPEATIVANQEGAEVDRAVTVAEQMLTANPEINGMYGEAGGATIGAYKAVTTAGKVGQIFVFGSDMTTEIATELEKGDVLKSVVDISGIEVGTLAWAAVQDGLDGKTPSEKIVQAPITLWDPTTAAEWLSTHPDGLP
ncbi:substrate-binding domain-containing protein [Agromyces albus]|uniref:Sugar ABC transporter substrate-binding protein n=1 Tax=Agromyces albus TaxID=205332 RepID=A0A4Q2KXI6_9MICO|nr:substrate-binding domain-containing protein [Agromyces albus]RXZ68633.1 sugar ABC transporter substrate-binding protein [Agromyces albus]